MTSLLRMQLSAVASPLLAHAIFAGCDRREYATAFRELCHPLPWITVAPLDDPQEQHLGCETYTMPAQGCRAARALAMHAYATTRGRLDAGAAQRTSTGAIRAVGLGCVGRIAAAGRGACLAAQSNQVTETWHVDFPPTIDAIAAGAEILALLLLQMAGTDSDRFTLHRAAARAEIVVSRTRARPGWSELLDGKLAAVGYRGTALQAAVPPQRHAHAAVQGDPVRVVFPGAFNPLHRGHRRMVHWARQRLGAAPAFEISLTNVDKPPLDFTEMDYRLRQFGPDDFVWFTRAATFVDKAELFPGATFLVGADTLRRIADARYYPSPAARDQALAALAARGCRFLVFGRLQQGVFVTLRALQVPDCLAALCEEVPENEFREDIASSQLRHCPVSQPEHGP
jgi:hypothetical protein